MNVVHTELLVCGCLLVAVLVGVGLRRCLPDHHLTADSRDAVKLAMGLVATMTALVCWLVVIFIGFSLLAPPNITTTIALLASLLSVAGAVFLILELDQPMSGLIRISSAPILNTLNQLAK